MNSQAHSNELAWQTQRSSLENSINKEKKDAASLKDRAEEAGKKIKELETGLAAAEACAKDRQKTVDTLRTELENIKQAANESSKAATKLERWVPWFCDLQKLTRFVVTLQPRRVLSPR